MSYNSTAKQRKKLNMHRFIINIQPKVTNESEVDSIAIEGFSGWVAGWFSGMLPVGASVVNSVLGNEISHKKKEIERVAKLIEKVKNGALEEAKKEGSVDEATYAAARAVDWMAILSGAILGAIPVISAFTGASRASNLQNLSNELKTKIKELQDLAAIAKSNADAK